MREIKFRFWSGNKMFGHCEGTMDCVKQQACGVYDHVKEHGASIMQYTGFKGKNGVEFYEGDIVRCGDDSFIAEIFFAEKALCWSAQIYHQGAKVEIMTLGRYIFSREKAVRDKAEVIGNIYENPELLKK